MILDQYGTPYSPRNTYSLYGNEAEIADIGMDDVGPNEEVETSLSNLRNVSRRFIALNSYASAGIKSFVSNLVGTGIKPVWILPEKDSETKKRLEDLWERCSQNLNFIHSKASFSTDQASVANATTSDGECFCKFIYTEKTKRNPVPFQYQLLEADYVDEGYSETLSENTRVKMGFGLDRHGRTIAYHTYREHPNDYHYIYGSQERVPIPVNEMLHISGYSTRLGSLRTKPELTPVLLKLHWIEEAMFNELGRIKNTSLLGGVLKQDYGAPPLSVAPQIVPPGMEAQAKDDGIGKDIKIKDGAYLKLPPGYDISTVQQSGIQGAVDEFFKTNLRSVAKNFGGISYEQMTGDLSGVNYSSIRAGLIDARRLLNMNQKTTLIEPFCQPVIEEWVKVAVISGAITIDDYFNDPYKYTKVQWWGQPHHFVDPDKELKAIKTKIRLGLTTLTKEAMEHSMDVETLFQNVSEVNKMIDELGIVLDSDPRKTSGNGALQSQQANTKEEQANV